MSLFAMGTEENIAGLEKLGYPAYFGIMLSILKFIGSSVIIIPKIPNRIKEWAYGCFFIEFLFAFVSILIMEGKTLHLVFPIIAILVLSLIYWSHNETKS